MTTKVWVTEEYGYREWLWIHPGSVDDVVADWKAGRIPTCIHVYRYDDASREAHWDSCVENWQLPEEEREKRSNSLWEPQTGNYAGTCQLWDPKLAHWMKLEQDCSGHEDDEPFLRAAIELHTRVTQYDALCQEHGITMGAHCHEWDDSSLHILGTKERFGAWWQPQDWEKARREERELDRSLENENF